VNIIQSPNPILKKKAERVEKIDSEILNIVKKMKKNLKEVPGVALAAPQVGISKAIVVTGYKPKNKDDITIPEMTLINPEITEKSKDTEELEEGCLSVIEPELRGKVNRAKRVKVSAQNEKGEKIEIKAKGFFARVLQHEIDHLEGKLFLDRADPTTLYKPKKENHEKERY
jgi:peptide deformylase